MTERDDEAAADAARREGQLLAHLDGLAYPVWAEVVRWAAPGLARENPRLLAEAVAGLFGELGLAVCVREG